MAGESSLEIRSKVTSNGKMEISLETVTVPEPGENEVLVRVEAAPINPSDLGLLIGPADVSTLKVTGSGNNIVARMNIDEALMRGLQPRMDDSLAVGNEGAGVVVAAGANTQALIGKTVGVAAGSMYAQFRCVPASSCLVMNEGTSPAEGASCFVNPLTALGMVETMKMEGHTALVHTAASSNLGQMLVKICLADDVPLVNIVRRTEHVALLKSLGAQLVCNSSEPEFMKGLIAALVSTGATIAFDATGGGKLTGQILTAMEIAANQSAEEYNRYGSATHKQVYIYGGLDRTPTTFNRAFGMAWGIGGWLLTPFIQKAGTEVLRALRQRVADEIKTTFASHYTREVSLSEALSAQAIASYSKQATGEKYLICPHA